MVLTFLLGFQVFRGSGVHPDQEIDTINQEIERLEEVKVGFEAKALRHESAANRLQFQQGQYIIAKKHWEQAEINRLAAKKVQEQIDALKKRKKSLLQKQESRNRSTHIPISLLDQGIK